MKRIKITYWTATIIIFLMEGVLPALTSQTELAKEGIRHLGYPPYFGVMLTFFKVTGALVLVLPFAKGRIKEWAYFGFAITMTSAFVSHWAVDGWSFQTVLPLIFLAILITSYTAYLRLATHSTSESLTIKTTNHVFSGVSN